MAAVFVRLKLRLLLSGLRGSLPRRIAFGLGVVLGLVLAVVGFVSVAATGRSDDLRQVTVVFGGLTAGWIILPIFAFGVDELLDPGRLALLPLTGPSLMTGLLASGLIGVPPIATLIALCGAFPGFARSPLGAALVGAAVTTQLLMCLVLSRAVTTALSGLLRSRRGRDVTAVLLAGVGASLGGLGPAVTAAATRLDSPAGRALYTLARYSPLGAAGGAVAAVGAGEYAVAAGQLALALGYLGAALLWWRIALQRSLTTAEASSRARDSAGPTDLRPRLYRRLLPTTPVGTVAAKDLRYLWRDPMRRSAVLATLGPAGITIFSSIASGAGDPRSVLFVMVTATMLSLIALNQFGLDGAAYWMNVVAGHDPRRDLLGKNLAVALVAIPATAVLAVVVAALTGGWAYIPLAIAGGAAGCGVTLGVANVVSIRAPAPQAENAANAWAGGGGGQSMGVALTQFGSLLLVAVILAPLGAFIVYSALRWTPGLFLAVPLSLAYGGTLWRLGLRSATRRLWWGQAELLQAIRPRRAA